jgi:AraC-like DNA-binding protein
MQTPLDVTFVTGFRQVLPAGNQCGFHSHDCTEIVYHPSGSGTTRMGTNLPELHFAPGSIVAYPPGLVHDQRMATEGVDCCVIVRCRLGRRSWPARTLHIPVLRDPCIIKEILSLCVLPSAPDKFQQRLHQARGTAVVCGLLAEETNAEVAACPDLATVYIQRALRYIDEHLQTVASVADVAQAVGLSGEHLRHLFARQTGGTLSRYVVQARVRRATDLLRHTTLPLKAIAAVCGFRNERYLCAVYKKATGRTPGQQRQIGRD